MARKTLKKSTRCHYTRKRGGATNKLPGITDKMTLREFEAQWDVFYISAHGALESELIEVPENTYILNSTPSGEACTLSSADERLDRFYKGNDDTLGYDDEFMEFIQNPRTVFEFVYNRIPERRNYKSLMMIPRVTSIYEPSDAIYDMKLQFASHVVKKENMAERGITHFIVPGIFKLPISPVIKAERNRSLKAVGSIAPNMMEKALKTMNTEFINLKGNLLKSIIESTGKSSFKLSELLGRPELQASFGKKRFIIIHACKSMFGAKDNARLMVRRGSIGRIIASENNRAKPVSAAASAVVAVNKPADGGPGKPADGGPGKSVEKKKDTMFGFKPGFLTPPKKATKPAAVAEGK